MNKNNHSNQPKPYKKWCKVMGDKATEEFKKNTRLEFPNLKIENSLNKLRDFLSQHYPDEYIPKITKLEATIYFNDKHQENFILDHHQNLYIRSFLFHTLTQNTMKELVTLVLFFYLQKKQLLIDLLLDLFKSQDQFLESRKSLLKEEEYQAIFGNMKSNENHFIRGLLFVSILHYPDNYKTKISLIETKNLKEIYFFQKMKKLLNLDESDYEYIQINRPWDHLSAEEQEKFTVIKNEIENNRINIEDYVQNYLGKKKILFWCLWTISPFLAIDISRMFSVIHEYKNIKRVYLDMPQSSQEVVSAFIDNNHYPETTIENEIKKIYPSIVNDYAKETLPYIKILEKLQLFKIPQTCIGMEGDRLSKCLPFFKNNQLIFEIDETWEKTIHKEMRELDHNDDEELIIFFYFLKPMSYFHPYVKENPNVETLIHADPFTGYGPNKSESQLSFYSHYHPLKQQIPSFVLPELDRFSLKNEKIVFFPYKDEDYFRINDDLFNRFYLFNSLLFSSNRGGGGRRQSSFSPLTPDRRRIRV